ncbi:MAG TPA: Gfo/Idh/MocA family oxidoreductase [Nocardioides sp.]|jgi:predicted dehydrogenase|uniref:Gfo/Idh/MocA family protein n=1 Tax=Nocardioides sp. TaxID=35761 RepID=UPI002E317CD8|nr:Gfo/Idh/MocA family oxidoreductase [Nocardioides sp.]HEX3931512.1 Gfo/Idh/MocA family oxidoreductase [Nocardioides sp.]
MMRVAVVGVGKMGLSHLSLLGAHPDVEVAAICDSSGYLLDVLSKNIGIAGVKDYDELLERTDLDAVVIATPTHAHFPMVKAALERGLHVFCEKPLTLDASQSIELAALAREKGLHAQVGYHNRFVAAFAEAKRLVDAGAIGEIRHAQAEAYGPVVLRAKGGTWRSRRADGGGCLYDYAAHPLDLLTWYLGEPTSVGGTVLGSIFSASTEDEVYATIYYGGAVSAQLSVNWSDESYRKMSTKITLSGTAGRITVDRQECQVYLRDTAVVPEGYEVGWNVRYTTDLTPPVWFYVRGEEYSAELDHFVRAIEDTLPEGQPADLNSFASAAVTDSVIDSLLRDAEDAVAHTMVPSASTGGHRTQTSAPTAAPRRRGRWGARRRRRAA